MDAVWPFIFLAVVLKIPLIWVGMVVWRAIKAVPEPGDDVEGVRNEPAPGRGPVPRRFRSGPHGSRSGRGSRRVHRRAARAEAESR